MKDIKFYFLTILFGLINITSINSSELLKNVPYAGLFASKVLIHDYINKEERLFKLEEECISELTESSLINEWFNGVLKKYNIADCSTITIKKGIDLDTWFNLFKETNYEKASIKEDYCHFDAMMACSINKVIIIEDDLFKLIEKALKNEIANIYESKYILNSSEAVILHELGHIVANDSARRKIIDRILSLKYKLLFINSLIKITKNHNNILPSLFQGVITITTIKILLAKYRRIREKQADEFAMSKIQSVEIIEDFIKFFKNSRERGLIKSELISQKIKEKYPDIGIKINELNNKGAYRDHNKPSLFGTHPCYEDRIKMLEKRRLELLTQKQRFIKSSL